MSSSTQITFIFPYLTSLEVVTGTGSLANKLGVSANDQQEFRGSQAMQIMNGLHVQQELNLFDRSILNLMIERQVRHEEDAVSSKFEASNHEQHEGLMVVVMHCR